jgi:hypothetical protein
MSIDTNLLGSTVAELVGVAKENQRLVLNLVSALNRRHPKNPHFILELKEALNNNELLELPRKNIQEQYHTLFEKNKLGWNSHFNYVLDHSRGDIVFVPPFTYELLENVSVGELNGRRFDYSFSASEILAFIKGTMGLPVRLLKPVLFVTQGVEQGVELRYYTKVSQSEHRIDDFYADTFLSSENSQSFESVLVALPA